MKKFKLRKFYMGIVYFFILLYMEVIFKVFINDSIFDFKFIYILIFCLSLTFLLKALCSLSNRSVNKVIYLIFLFLLSLIYSVQLCVYKMFGFYFDWSLLKATNQVVDFAFDGVMVVLQNIVGVILFFLPFIFFMIFNKVIVIERKNFSKNILNVMLSALIYFSFLGFLKIQKNDNNSPYKLYYEINNVELNIKSFGVLHSFLIDTKRNIWKFNEKVDIVIKDSRNDNIEKDYDYNNLDIDFDRLIQNESDENIKLMHEYFKNETGTKQNEYTNYFAGKNLILFMAESFNEIAVREDLTPTLYRLVHSGFVFNNFYTPTISSTIGGEFQELTGLVAASGFLNPWKSGTNKFPFGIANAFQSMNYSTFAYHDHNYTFQNRYKYLKMLGFNNFKGCNNGLEDKINCKIWPESDVEMIESTFDDYINSDKPFFTYYVTVSGHGDYGFNKSAMAKKHQDDVKDLNYSEKPLAYLAAQIELDKALELLIEKLKASGKLDDTVIALVGDHYPYYLSIDEVNEISSYKKDDVVEVNKSNFILWNNKMENVEINKVGSQIDVLPTIYNLFGVKYDSRLIIGKDILSDEEGLAIFGNRSWVSDKGTYFARSNKFVPNKDVSISDDYIKTMNTIVSNKVIMSKNIMVYDYYGKVLGE